MFSDTLKLILSDFNSTKIRLEEFISEEKSRNEQLRDTLSESNQDIAAATKALKQIRKFVG